MFESEFYLQCDLSQQRCCKTIILYLAKCLIDGRRRPVQQVNFSVEAPAGSGKTRILQLQKQFLRRLIQRRLLSEDEVRHRVLFTTYMGAVAAANNLDTLESIINTRGEHEQRPDLSMVLLHNFDEHGCIPIHTHGIWHDYATAPKCGGRNNKTIFMDGISMNGGGDEGQQKPVKGVSPFSLIAPAEKPSAHLCWNVFNNRCGGEDEIKGGAPKVDVAPIFAPMTLERSHRLDPKEQYAQVIERFRLGKHKLADAEFLMKVRKEKKRKKKKTKNKSNFFLFFSSFFH